MRYRHVHQQSATSGGSHGKSAEGQARASGRAICHSFGSSATIAFARVGAMCREANVRKAGSRLQSWCVPCCYLSPAHAYDPPDTPLPDWEIQLPCHEVNKEEQNARIEIADSVRIARRIHLLCESVLCAGVQVRGFRRNQKWKRNEILKCAHSNA